MMYDGRSIFQRPGHTESHDFGDFSIGLGMNLISPDFKLEYIDSTLRKDECVEARDRVVLTVSKTF
jgi:hypothetical protein